MVTDADRGLDGTRVGAVCVFDPAPRDEGTVELDLLRDFAVLARDILIRALRTSPVSGLVERPAPDGGGGSTGGRGGIGYPRPSRP